MSTRFTFGVGQILVEGGQPHRNLDRAAAMVRSAGEAGCRAIVLPECLDVGWTHPSAKHLAKPIPGKHSQLLGDAARSSGLYVVAGLTERSGDEIYNSAVLLSPEGEILLKHRKINELDIASSLYGSGTSLAVARTELGAIGITICADNFPDSLVFGHSLARMGAQILLSPCAWAVDADHDNFREPYGALWLDAYVPLARMYDLTIVAASNVGWLSDGPWKGRKCIGCSLAVGPGGDVLMKGPYGENAEALLRVEVEPRPPIARGTQFAEELRRRAGVSDWPHTGVQPLPDGPQHTKVTSD
jgi:predicted amidohydrolase